MKIHKRNTLCEYFYPVELEIKDATNTASSASYHDLHIEIDNEDRLINKLYDRRDDLLLKFTFPE